MNLDMVCTCSAPGILEVEAMRLRMMQRLGLKDPADLATAVVLSLAFDFGADVVVEADQWFGVGVAGTRPELWKAFLECDNPWDGLTAVLAHAMDRWPEHASVGPGVESDVWRAGSESARRTSAYMAVRLAAKDHYVTHKPADYTPGCAECRARMGYIIAAYAALDQFWGMDGMG